MKEKKYELTNETMNFHTLTEEGFTDIKLYRIKALKDFGDVKAGDLGGFVEREENLSQEGTCWIYGEGIVAEDARVEDDARVSGHSYIHGNVIIGCQATIIFSRISGYSNIGDTTTVADCRMDNVAVSGKTLIQASHLDHCCIYDSVVNCVEATGDIDVFGNIVIQNANITGPILIPREAEIRSNDEFKIIRLNSMQKGNILVYRTGHNLYEPRVRFDYNTLTIIQFEIVLQKIMQGDYPGYQISHDEFDEVVNILHDFAMTMADLENQFARLEHGFVKNYGQYHRLHNQEEYDLTDTLHDRYKDILFDNNVDVIKKVSIDWEWKTSLLCREGHMLYPVMSMSISGQ